MKRDKNPAFFQSKPSAGSVVVADVGNNIRTVLRNARSTGSILLTDRKLTEIPNAVFSIETSLEADEKFWEIQPTSKMDMSNNDITTIPPQIASLSNLVILKLRNNKIESISKEFFNCSSLTHLDLSGNCISNLDVAIGNLGLLCDLNMGNNTLRSLPESICNLQRITNLDLSNNVLELLPDRFGLLSNMIKLNLSNNKLEHLPESICGLRMLQDLNVKKNKLEDLPNLTGLTGLTVLDASDNKIARYPRLPAKDSTAIARLYLANNRLASIDSSRLVAGESSLVELDVQGNILIDIPMDIGMLQKLKLLNAANNNLSDIPFTLGYISSLQRIVLDGNPLRTIRRSLLTQSTSDLKKYLRTRGPEPPYVQAQEASYHFADIDVFDERLREMSGGVLNCSGLSLSLLPIDFITKLNRSYSFDETDVSMRLSHLNLSNNNFCFIPAEIFDITSLQVLDLRENNLGASHPQELFRVSGCFPSGLKVLNISKNGLSSDAIALIISKLSVARPSTSETSHSRFAVDHVVGLQSLLCSENKMTSLPSNIHNLRFSLREFQCSFNQISSVSNVDFGELNKLEIIEMSSNRLVTLGNIYAAKNLTDILVSNNELRDIPVELGLLKKVRNLSILGNPQKTVRMNVIQQGTEAIIKVLKNRLPEEVETQHSNIMNSAVSSFKDPVTSVPIVRSSQDFEENSSDSRSQLTQECSSISKSKNIIRTTFKRPDETSLSRRSDGTMNNRNVFNSIEQSDSEITTIQNNKDFLELQDQVLQLSHALESSSLSEQKRFAIKKDLAKARANLLRLSRNNDRVSR